MFYLDFSTYLYNDTLETALLSLQDGVSSFIGRLSSRSFLGPFLGVGVVSILMRLSGYAVISHFTATFLSDSGVYNFFKFQEACT